MPESTERGVRSLPILPQTVYAKSLANQVQVLRKASGEIERIRLKGPLGREMSAELERLVSGISHISRADGLVVDATEVSGIDGVVAELVAELVGIARLRGVRVAVVGLRADIAERIAAVDHAGVLSQVLAASEAQVSSVLDLGPPAGRQRLAFGVDHYRRTHLPRYADLFKQLAIGQTPHTLFVTCSDSRINPALMTSTDPGELFLVRNVGNMVPRHLPGRHGSAAAAVEYAVGVLGVSEVVVCAHSGCGAIHALRNPDAVPPGLPALEAWVRQSEVGELCRLLPVDTLEDDVTRINARKQLDNLRSYPVVQERVASGALELHAWFFHIGTGEIEQWDTDASEWIHVTASSPENEAVSLPPRVLSPGSHAARTVATVRHE